MKSTVFILYISTFLKFMAGSNREPRQETSALKINKTNDLQPKINEGVSTLRLKKNSSKCRINEGASTSYIHFPSNDSIVNVGASTSGLQQQQRRQCLIYAEKNKINAFVDDKLNLIATDLRQNSPNEPDPRQVATSLRQFYRELGNYLRYGPNYNASGEYPRLLSNYVERIRYYDLSIRRDVLQTLIDSRIYHENLEYTQEQIQFFSRTILKNLCKNSDTTTSSSGSLSNTLLDICSNYVHQFRPSRIFDLIKTVLWNNERIVRLEMEAQQPNATNIDGHVINGVQIKRYSIIPSELIDLFF